SSLGGSWGGPIQQRAALRKRFYLSARAGRHEGARHFSSSAATALMRLREYFGRPALIELPVLNELLPANSCAGTRLRRIGTVSNSFFFSNRSLSTASAMKAVATDVLASAGLGC